MRQLGQDCDLEANRCGLWIYDSGKHWRADCRRYYQWNRKRKDAVAFQESRLYGFDIALAAHGLLNARPAADNFIREMNR